MSATPAPLDAGEREAAVGVLWVNCFHPDDTIDALLALGWLPPSGVAARERERDTYRTALWDVFVALGGDTDGDTGPGALIAGAGAEGWARSVVEDAARWRKESEGDYDADVRAAGAKALREFADNHVHAQTAGRMQEDLHAEADRLDGGEGRTELERLRYTVEQVRRLMRCDDDECGCGGWLPDVRVPALRKVLGDA